MSSQLFDIQQIREGAIDSVSSSLTNLVVFLSGLKKINKLVDSIGSETTDPSFFDALLARLNIKYDSLPIILPKDGPCVVYLPVLGGLIDILSTYAAIYKQTERCDIKFFVTEEQFAQIKSFSSYCLNVNSFNVVSVYKAALSHLKQGGVVVFIDHSSNLMTNNSLNINFPLSLAQTSCSTLIAFLVKHTKSRKFHLFSYVNKWFYSVFYFRTLFSKKNSNLSILSSNIITNSKDAEQFYNDNLDGSLASLFGIFVPRGTKR